MTVEDLDGDRLLASALAIKLLAASGSAGNEDVRREVSSVQLHRGEEQSLMLDALTILAVRLSKTAQDSG